MKEINIYVFLEMTLFATGIAICSGSLSISFIYLSNSVIDKMELLTVFSYAGSAMILIGIGKILEFINGILKWSKLSLSVISFLIVMIVFLFHMVYRLMHIPNVIFLDVNIKGAFMGKNQNNNYMFKGFFRPYLEKLKEIYFIHLKLILNPLRNWRMIFMLIYLN